MIARGSSCRRWSGGELLKRLRRIGRLGEGRRRRVGRFGGWGVGSSLGGRGLPCWKMVCTIWLYSGLSRSL